MPAWLRRFVIGENVLIAVVLGAMVLLPLIEAFFRLLHRFTGLEISFFSGTMPVVQHLVLILGMLGGLIAAREARLLSFSTISTFLKGRWKSLALMFSSGVSAGLTFLLGTAGWTFALSQRGEPPIQWGVPGWLVSMILPIGFIGIALRLSWKSSEKWSFRGGSFAIAALVVILGARFPAESMTTPALILLLAATLLGAPIYTALGGAGLILFWGSGVPTPNLSVDHYSMSTHQTLPTIPLFTLAGYFLAEGGASRRLIRVFHALVGHLKGGEAILTVFVCAFFTSFTGASGVTILALGGLLMPVLVAARFSERNALGLLTGSGALGLLFAPCIPLILYAIVASGIQANLAQQPAESPAMTQVMDEGLGALEDLDLSKLDDLNLDDLDLSDLGLGMEPAEETNAVTTAGTTVAAIEDTDSGKPAMRDVTIEGMFLGGLMPGILLVVLCAIWGRMKSVVSDQRERFNPTEAVAAVKAAGWELALPVVALVSIFGGFATMVEAAALTAAYAFFVETFIYRDLKVRKDVPRVMAECGLLVGGVLLILGVAQGFNNFLITEEFPQQALAWVQANISSPLVFLLALNVFLLIVGCLMDVFSAIIVVAPMIIPMGLAFGIDPIHLGIIFLANLELGYMTPPVGLNLFLSAYRFNKPLPEVYRAVIPILIVMAVGVLAITYIPALTTFLPDLLLSGPE